MKKKTVRIGPRLKLSGAHSCPCCGRGPLNGCRNVSESPAEPIPCAPRPGDWQLCSYCKRWLVTTKGGGLRPATAADEFELRVKLPNAAEAIDQMPPAKWVE